jgi:hypothetical protein
MQYLVVVGDLAGGARLQEGPGCWWRFYFLGKMLGARLRFEAVKGCGDCCPCVIEV